MYSLREWRYKGIIISIGAHGYYNAYLQGYGFLKADTLSGMRKLINQYMEG